MANVQQTDNAPQPEEPNPETQSWENLAENQYAMAVCFILGAVCSAAFPYAFIDSITVATRVSIIMVLAYIFIALNGYNNREQDILRKPPPVWVNKYALSVTSILLSLLVSVFFEFHKKPTFGYCLVALEVFFLTMIAQPVNDYGLLALFMTQPILSVMANYPLRLHPLYLPYSVMLLFCMGCQNYFVQPFDRRYAERMKDISGSGVEICVAKN